MGFWLRNETGSPFTLTLEIEDFRESNSHRARRSYFVSSSNDWLEIRAPLDLSDGWLIDGDPDLARAKLCCFVIEAHRGAAVNGSLYLDDMVLVEPGGPIDPLNAPINQLVERLARREFDGLWGARDRDTGLLPTLSSYADVVALNTTSALVEVLPGAAEQSWVSRADANAYVGKLVDALDGQFDAESRAEPARYLPPRYFDRATLEPYYVREESIVDGALLYLALYPQPTEQDPLRMPKSFYDGIRALGFWIIRDIWFGDYKSADAIPDGREKIDAVIEEVESAEALDRVFAWEIMDEFTASGADIPILENFLAEMRDHIKARMEEPHRQGFSDWVTWGSFPPNDSLRTAAFGNPISVELDYYCYNVYPYDPVRIRNHQAGPVTGTPYAGYLHALKNVLDPEKPLVISETGLPDSPATGANEPEQAPLHPWYPVYRKGELNGQQVAEGLVDRYMDARLTGLASGMGVFEWNDEWWKAGDPSNQDHPEEHFGVGRFDPVSGEATYELRYKLQQEAVRDLFTLDFNPDHSIVTNLTAAAVSLAPGAATTIHATVDPAAPGPVRYRWECSRGRIVGDSETVQLHAGDVALGPAEVTVLAIDADGQASTASVTIEIEPVGGEMIEILTLGTGMASGRTANVNLDQYKVVVYVKTDQQWAQPYTDAPYTFVGPDGYWWTQVHNNATGELIAWVVPEDFEPTNRPGASPPPEGTVADARQTEINDSDNDLLPDAWEQAQFGNLNEDRYGDPDGDMAHNLEELLAGINPSSADNDSDADTLPDNWERLFFRTLAYGTSDDPDGDGLNNVVELELGIHPGRTAPDRDRDGLPDIWEIHYFAGLGAEPSQDPNADGLTNLDAYELGTLPVD